MGQFETGESLDTIAADSAVEKRAEPDLPGREPARAEMEVRHRFGWRSGWISQARQRLW